MPTELQWFTTFNLPFGEPRPFPIVLSHEFSGVVESVGAKVNAFTITDEVIDYRTTRFEEVAREVDVVFDGVGGDTLERSLAVLAKGGWVVTVATQSEGAADQRVRDGFMLVRADGSQLAEVANLIDTGELRLFVAGVFPLAAARTAYALARQCSRPGKIALRITA